MNLHNHLPFPMVNPLANPLIKAVRPPLLFRGGGGGGGGGGEGITGPPYTDITLFNRFEAGTMTTGDYYGADDTWGFLGTGGDSEISADAAIVGSAGLRCYDTTSGSGFCRLDVTNDDICNIHEGRLGFWVNWDESSLAANDDFALFNIYGDTYNTFRVMWTPVPGTWELIIRSDSDYVQNDFTNAASIMTDGVEYFVEFAWKQSTNYAEVFIDGVSMGTISLTWPDYEAGVDVTRFHFGVGNSVGGGDGYNVFFDNLMISNDSTRNLYALRNETSSPRAMS